MSLETVIQNGNKKLNQRPLLRHHFTLLKMVIMAVQTALFLSLCRCQQAELAPKPKAEATKAPETRRFFRFSLKSSWQGFQSPSVSGLAPKIMCGECNTSGQLSRNRQCLLFSRTIIAFIYGSPFFCTFQTFYMTKSSIIINCHLFLI